MRIGSILIGGDEWKPLSLVEGFEIVNETGGNFGTLRMKVLYDPSAIGANIIEPGDTVIITAEGGPGGEPDQLFGQPLFGDPLFGKSESTQNIFYGNVVSVEPSVMVIAGAGPDPVNVMLIEAVNRMSMLETAQVEAAEYTAQDDDDIIYDVFGTEIPVVDLANVNMTTTLATFDRHDESLRAMMERLQERTGATMWMGPANAPDFHWMLPSSNPAPFSFSDNPDYLASFPCDRERMHVRRDWRTPANSVTVLGQVGTGGVRVRVTVTDAASIAAYGTKGRTIVDPQITSTSEATLRGNVELERDANPQYSGTLITRYEGIEVGMLLTLDFTETLNFAGDFVVTRISQRWFNRNITESTIEWGLYRPNEAALLRALAEASRQPGAVLPGQPAPGTVGSGTLQNNAVQTTHIQDAAITSAKIGTAQIGNAHINDLSADKINTGDLSIGGSGKMGQFALYNGSNQIFAWGGRNASDYGLWTTTLWVGGTGPTNAKIKAEASGSITVRLIDGDDMEINSSTNTQLVRIRPDGLFVVDSGAPSNGSSITKTDLTITNSSSSSAVVEVFGGAAAVRAIGGGTNEIAIASNGSATALYIGGNNIIKARETGWSAASGSIAKGGFNTATVSLVDLAQNVKSIIDALIYHGVIG